MAATLRRLGGLLYDRPYLLVSLTYLMWAINIVLGRHAAGHIPPVTLSVWRWGLAGLILLPVAWPYLKHDWPVIRANLPLIAFLSLAGTTGYAVPSYWGLQYTQAINGLLIQCTMPMVIGFMSYALFRDRLTAMQLIGIAVSFVGVLFVLMRGDLDVLNAIAFNRGDVWFIGANLIFASYSALMKKRPPLHPLSFLAVTAIVGTLLIVPLYLWETATVGMPALDVKTITIVLYVAIFPSILAYICFNRGVQLVGPNRTAALYPLIIVFGAIIAILFLGEQPQFYHAVGSALIVGGVLLATRQSRIKTPSEAPRR